MKVSADYRMLALDALRGKWKTAVLTGIAASALGATIVSSSNSVVSNSNQAKDIHFNLFAQPNGGRLLAVLLVGIGLWAILQLVRVRLQVEMMMKLEKYYREGTFL